MGRAVQTARRRWWGRIDEDDTLELPATAHPTTEQLKSDVHEAQNRLVFAQTERDKLIRECDDIIERREQDVTNAQANYAQSVLDDLSACGLSYRHLVKSAEKKPKPTEPEVFE